MVSNVGLTYFYANNFLTVDEDKYETQELYTEGLMNSFGAFLVIFFKNFLKKKMLKNYLVWILNNTFLTF